MALQPLLRPRINNLRVLLGQNEGKIPQIAGSFVKDGLSAGQVSVTVTTHGGSTSDSYSYTVTGSPVSRGDCEEGDEDCPEGKKDKESGDSDEGETDEDSAEGGG